MGSILSRILVLAAVALLGAALAPLATSRPAAIPLRAVVGPSETIYVVNEAGARVDRLEPGEYTITIDDHASDHNFHLQGPGVDLATGVEFVGTRTWNVTLRDGVYIFVCDPHAGTMRGSVRVGAAATTTTTSAPPPVRVLAPGRLTAVVGPGPTIRLVRGSVPARVLRRGRYTITVRDRSRFHNFHLRGPGVARKTGVAFVGTRRWVVTLRRGTYVFVCDPHRNHMRGTVTVR